MAITILGSVIKWDGDDTTNGYVDEAKFRGLTCGVTKNNKTIIASNQTKNSNLDYPVPYFSNFV